MIHLDSNDPTTQNMERGVIERIFLNARKIKVDGDTRTKGKKDRGNKGDC